MKNKLILAVLAAAAPFAAQAEGGYVGGSVGNAQQKFTVIGLNIDDSAVGVKVFGGYQADENFGVEAGYTSLGKAEVKSVSEFARSKAHSLYAAGTARFPIGSKFAITGKLGMAKNYTRVSATGAASEKLDKTDALIGVGVSFAVTKNISLVVDYENYGTIINEGGLVLKARMISAGASYSF